MKNVIASIVAAAGLASLATADTSRLDMQVSTDGVTWSNNVNVAPGATVLVRGKVSFIQTGTATPVGFASLTWQPTLSNWVAGTDVLNAFADRGNNTNGGSVSDTAGTAGPFGRISPFGATGPTSTDPYRGHTQTAAGVNYLRIARTTITNWAGDGPTTGTSASNNFNGSGGLACVQKSSGNVGAADPPFQGSITDVVLFKFSVTVAAPGTRTLTVDAPLAGMSRNTTTGAREAAWFSSGSDNFGGIKAEVAVNTATISVPTPGGLAALGLGGLVAVRRRRR
ncbi:MAG: hypothetical protein JSR77_00465 [Planctomycetes bacterium]|nr:hypothetical protein [Planctomycetota bacterium]